MFIYIYITSDTHNLVFGMNFVCCNLRVRLAPCSFGVRIGLQTSVAYWNKIVVFITVRLGGWTRALYNARLLTNVSYKLTQYTHKENLYPTAHMAMYFFLRFLLNNINSKIVPLEKGVVIYGANALSLLPVALFVCSCVTFFPFCSY